MMNKNTVIKLEKIKKSYILGGQEIMVLKGLDLNVKEGEFVAIMGESGGGKSTLLNIIGCLHPLTSGKYYLNDEDIGEVRDDYTLAFIRNKKMGFIFQQFNLFNKMSALKNVALPSLYDGQKKEEREERAKKILTNLGLGSRMYHKPKELSGGQQQRVSIARSLINSPDIILADEPTGALDSETGKEIMDLFVSLKKMNKTLIMVTHSGKAAKYADRIIFLKDGLIVDNNYKIK